MKNRIAAALYLLAASSLVAPLVTADPDPQLCLDCHEPAEDWTDLSMEQFLSEARNPDNPRHADNDSLSDEDLRAILSELLPQ